MFLLSLISYSHNSDLLTLKILSNQFLLPLLSGRMVCSFWAHFRESEHRNHYYHYSQNPAQDLGFAFQNLWLYCVFLGVAIGHIAYTKALDNPPRGIGRGSHAPPGEPPTRGWILGGLQSLEREGHGGGVVGSGRV